MNHALSKLLSKDMGTRCADRSIMVGLRYTPPTNHRKITRCLTQPPQSYAGMAALFGASAARSKKTSGYQRRLLHLSPRARRLYLLREVGTAPRCRDC